MHHALQDARSFGTSEEAISTVAIRRRPFVKMVHNGIEYGLMAATPKA